MSARLSPVLEREEASRHLSHEIAAADWSAIVPAAGRGSRLGAREPKILYPLAGRPLLDHLMDLLAGLCSRVVLVLSPDGLPYVQPHLSRFKDRNVTTALQAAPRGMADAVHCGLPHVATEHTLVMWGDQAGLRRSSIELAMRLHAGPLAPAATVPTVLNDRPYIHFERDARGQIVDVLQAREGCAMPERGESDCGLFLFRTAALKRFLPRLMQDAQCAGAVTGEWNFLPLLPMMAGAGEEVLSARIPSIGETLGLNTREDAARLSEDLLSQRSAAT
jgi:bifunctional UDP-N-acetylglucosamine pyrophosphorylase/glucosamine-1-phosphate N-acetyltransferase